MPTTTGHDGTTIAYDVAGHGPPLVLVHGITESSATWAPVLPALTAQRTVVTMDLRGHGRSSTAPAYDLRSMALDLGAVVEASGVGDDAVLVGHSLGGAVVSAAPAFGVPCRAIVDVDQPLALGEFQDALRQVEPMLRGDETLFRTAIGMLFDAMADALTGEPRARLEAGRRADQTVVLGVWDLVLTSARADLDVIVEQLASAIAVPYLSLHGIDPGTGYEPWLRALVPTAVVEVWPDVGHYPHLVHPDRFVERVLALP